MIFIDRHSCQADQFSFASLFVVSVFAPGFRDRENWFGKMLHAHGGRAMPTKLSDLGALQGKFFVFSSRGHWRIECMECSGKWALDKKPDLHPGNLLHLLNHAAGHQETEEIKLARREHNQEKLREVNSDALAI